MSQEESRQKQYPENYPYQENEIELIDYLRVLWKWKWLIIGGTLICAIIAGIISFAIPETYRVAMVIKPGVIGVDNSGNYTYMDSMDIRGKINDGAYNLKTSFKADVGKYTNLIGIRTECKKEDVEVGVKASKKLIALVSDDYGKVVKQKRDNYDRQIATKQNEITKIETQWEKDTDRQITHKLNDIRKKKNQIKLEQTTLETSRQRIKELTLGMEKIQDGMGRTVKRWETFLKGNKVNDDLFLRYAKVIQEKMVYSTQLNNQIYDLKTNVQTKEANIAELNNDIVLTIAEIEKLKLSRTEGLQAEIDNIKAQISVLIFKKENIGNIKVIQNPEASLNPVKSKRKRVILLSTVVGLFFFIFLTFFVEYIKKYQNQLRK